MSPRVRTPCGVRARPSRMTAGFYPQCQRSDLVWSHGGPTIRKGHSRCFHFPLLAPRDTMSFPVGVLLWTQISLDITRKTSCIIPDMTYGQSDTTFGAGSRSRIGPNDLFSCIVSCSAPSSSGFFINPMEFNDLFMMAPKKEEKENGTQ